MNIDKLKKFIAELIPVLTNVLPNFTLGFFVGFALFSQLPPTWYNVVLVLGLCFMSGVGLSAIIDIFKTSKEVDHDEFTIPD